VSTQQRNDALPEDPDERARLARRVAELREDGVPWDGPRGVCERLGAFRTAHSGRKLLREIGRDDLIRHRGW
jgi:hypothetical protein